MARETGNEERHAALRAAGLSMSPYPAIATIADLTEATELDGLALATGVLRAPDPVSGLVPSFNIHFHLAKVKARDAGFSWAEIASAMGEGSSLKAEKRVAARFHENQERLDEMRSAQGDS